jgi:hypothetical protein
MRSKRLDSLWRDLGIDGNLDSFTSARAEAWTLLEALGIDVEQGGVELAVAFGAAGAWAGAAAWTVLTSAESLPFGAVEKTIDVLLHYSSEWADFLVAHWPIAVDNWDDAATLIAHTGMNLFGLPGELFDFASTVLDGTSDVIDLLLHGHVTAETLMSLFEGIGDTWDGLMTAGTGILLSLAVGEIIDGMIDEKLAPSHAKLRDLCEAKYCRELVVRKLKAGLPAPAIAPDLIKLHALHWGF